MELTEQQKGEVKQAMQAAKQKLGSKLLSLYDNEDIDFSYGSAEKAVAEKIYNQAVKDGLKYPKEVCMKVWYPRRGHAQRPQPVNQTLRAQVPQQRKELRCCLVCEEKASEERVQQSREAIRQEALQRVHRLIEKQVHWGPLLFNSYIFGVIIEIVKAKTEVLHDYRNFQLCSPHHQQPAGPSGLV